MKKRILSHLSIILLFSILILLIDKGAIFSRAYDCYCDTDGLGYCFTNCFDSTSCDPEVCSCTPLDEGGFYECCAQEDESWGQNNCPGYCDPGCTPPACWAGTSTSGAYGYYGTRECTDDCGDKEYLDCYCSSECTPGGCPAGTSSTDLQPTSPLYPISSDPHSTPSCDNACNYTSYGSICYCPLCTPPPCGPVYETTSQGYGQVLDNNTPSCQRGYPDTPDYATKCNMTYRTCFCKPFKDCPSPLLNLNNLNPNLKLEDFRQSTNDCGVSPDEANDDCYEVESSQPTETFSIVDTAVEPNQYDFKDQSLSPYTHTGQYDASNFAKQGDLNDPTDPIEMIATYTDPDGASDIEAMFVWFRHESLTEPYGMPVHISSSATPQGSTQSSWGFMLRDTSSGWKPYVASFQSTPAVWTPANGTASVFYLPAPNQSNMIEVTIKGIVENTLTKSITLKFSLRFTNNGNLFGTQKASEGKYKILLMGLDKFSFTPYDNYDQAPDIIDFGDFWDYTYLLNGEDFTHYWSSNQLRYKDGVQSYARNWTNTGKTWILDFKDPILVNFPDSTPGFKKEIIENTIKVSWNIKDYTGTGTGNLFAIVGNIYLSGTNQKPLTLSGCSEEIVCRDDSADTPGNQILPVNEDDTLIGKLNLVPNNNASWAFKVNPNLNTYSHTGSITIDIGDNTIGNLKIYLTAFDDAGNVLGTQPLSENLADRFLTGGGLAFSPNTTFAQLPEENTSTWTNILPPYSPISGGLVKDNADFSSEMYANYASDLVNSLSTGSYRISSFTNWINNSSTSLYESLQRKYELHKKYIEAELTELETTNSPLSSLSECSTTYCKYNSSGDLIVNPGLLCNKNAVIFVNGNLTINPPLYNTTSPADSLSNLNGCIFVVRGTVNIGAGTNVSDNFEYDKINAFIISDNTITIGKDSTIPPSIVDGVYINGGLISKGETNVDIDGSIDIKRYLRLQERLVYPVFAIDLHPKYGMLAEKFFGNSYVIQSTEVGLKPY